MVSFPECTDYARRFGCVELLADCARVTGDSDLTVVALLSSLIGGTEATGHEAAAKFQKKTQ